MPAGDLLLSAMAWMDAFWDDEAALLWNVKRAQHLVRESGLYAMGLLQRADGTDVERAARALRSVVRFQFDAPGAPYDGTFRRAPEEPDPPADPVMWIHYDPNWRQFIGTNFAVIVDRYADALDRDLIAVLERSIHAAVAGEPDDRVSPSYANIALMKAWLDAWAGRTELAETFARSTYDIFAENDTFLEYNSPTYYGIDLWALALWRSSTPLLQDLGAKMESALWSDIARFYHAGLRTLCGPFDRAYGMDMNTHATPLGLWIWAAIGPDSAPFPDPTERFGHPHDICFAPCMAAFDAVVPDDARSHLTRFRGERLVERTITSDPRRVATAWIGNDVMLGGQTGPPSGIGWLQHHHATAHWRTSDGAVGWARVMPDTPVEATAEPGRLVIRSDGPRGVSLEVHPSPQLTGSGWVAGGREIVVETDGRPPVPGGPNKVLYEPSEGPLTLLITT